MQTVSVVIPCFNGERYLARTLESLRSQRFRHWECIVVDDGSADDSTNVVATYAATDPRIRLFRQVNSGVSRARNVGYSACSNGTKYLLFLDADDCLEPEMLAILVDHLERHPNVSLVYSAFVCIDEHDQLLPAGDARNLPVVRYAPRPMGVRTLPPQVLETPFVSIFSLWAGLMPSNCLLRRSVYETTPGWDEGLGRPGEDTDVFLQMALRGDVHYLARPLVRYRRHAAQYTGNGIAPGQERNLYRKWAHMRGLTAQQHATLGHARWFREERLGPYLWLTFGTWHLRNGTRVEGIKCYLRALRHLGTSLRWARAPQSPATLRAAR
jgi:GT2 family glycosyltransferase